MSERDSSVSQRLIGSVPKTPCHGFCGGRDRTLRCCRTRRCAATESSSLRQKRWPCVSLPTEPPEIRLDSVLLVTVGETCRWSRTKATG